MMAQLESGRNNRTSFSPVILALLLNELSSEVIECSFIGNFNQRKLLHVAER